MNTTIKVIKTYEDNSVVMAKIDTLFYIYSTDTNQYFSILSCDCPKSGGYWATSDLSAKGIKSVASGRSRTAAEYQWKKLIKLIESC